MRLSPWLPLFLLFATVLLTGCPGGGTEKKFVPSLREVAHSPFPLGALAFAPNEADPTHVRLFVAYPHTTANYQLALAEITSTGLVPYPDETWNEYDTLASRGADKRLYAVTGTTLDAGEFLWVLDSGNPLRQGTVKAAAKLLKIDPQSNRVVQNVPLGGATLPGSYLADVRVEAGKNFAYVSDAGAGGLLVVDLTTQRVRRVLTQHPSTRSDSTEVTVGGKPWRNADGSRPYYHVTGLELDSTNTLLYYHALHGKTLYRIATDKLRDPALTDAQLGTQVQRIADTGPADGLAFDRKGNLLLAAPNANAILRLSPQGTLDTLVHSAELTGPSRLAVSPDTWVFVSTGQPHPASQPPVPFRLFKTRPENYTRIGN